MDKNKTWTEKGVYGLRAIDYSPILGPAIYRFRMDSVDTVEKRITHHFESNVNYRFLSLLLANTAFLIFLKEGLAGLVNK